MNMDTNQRVNHTSWINSVKSNDYPESVISRTLCIPFWSLYARCIFGLFNVSCHWARSRYSFFLTSIWVQTPLRKEYFEVRKSYYFYNRLLTNHALQVESCGRKVYRVFNQWKFCKHRKLRLQVPGKVSSESGLTVGPTWISKLPTQTCGRYQHPGVLSIVLYTCIAKTL